jgi:hypothetical protein
MQGAQQPGIRTGYCIGYISGVAGALGRIPLSQAPLFS